MSKQTKSQAQERIVEFKKVLYGFDEKEVFEYIDLLNNNLNKAHEVFDEKLAQMKSANELLTYEKGSQDQKIQQLNQSYQELLEERNALKQEVDSHQDQADQIKSLQLQNQQLQEKIEGYKLLEDQNQQLKKQMIEKDMVSQMRKQQHTELLEEIEYLKKQNKDIMESFLQQQNRMDSEAAEKELKLTQMLQMHRFTLEQSQQTLAKLNKQFEESCEYMEKIQLDKLVSKEETEKEDNETIAEESHKGKGRSQSQSASA